MRISLTNLHQRELELRDGCDQSVGMMAEGFEEGGACRLPEGEISVDLNKCA